MKRRIDKEETQRGDKDTDRDKEVGREKERDSGLLKRYMYKTVFIY